MGDLGRVCCAAVQDGHNPHAPLYRGFVHALKTIARDEVRQPRRGKHMLGFGACAINHASGALVNAACPSSNSITCEARAAQGLRGMYAGLAPNLVGASVSWGVYFYR